MTTEQPLTIPLQKAHELVGSLSRTQFRKIFVDSGAVNPVDMGGRGLSVMVEEVKEAVRKRAEMIRSGELVPPIRSARGKPRAETSAGSSSADHSSSDQETAVGSSEET